METELTSELYMMHPYDDVYEEIPDYFNVRNGTYPKTHYDFANGTVAKARDEGQYEGCVGMSYYTDSLTIHHDRFKNRLVSMEAKDSSGNNCPPSQSCNEEIPDSMKQIQSKINHPLKKYDGFEDFADYTASLLNCPERFTNGAVSKETEEESGYSHPHSQHEGYVGMMDYSDTLSPPENVTDQKSPRRQKICLDHTLPQSRSEDYEDVLDFPNLVQRKDAPEFTEQNNA